MLCRVDNVLERLGVLLSPVANYFCGGIFKHTQQRFEDMNVALKQRAESLCFFFSSRQLR